MVSVSAKTCHFQDFSLIEQSMSRLSLCFVYSLFLLVLSSNCSIFCRFVTSRQQQIIWLWRLWVKRKIAKVTCSSWSRVTWARRWSPGRAETSRCSGKRMSLNSFSSSSVWLFGQRNLLSSLIPRRQHFLQRTVLGAGFLVKLEAPLYFSLLMKMENNLKNNPKIFLGCSRLFLGYSRLF